MNPLIADVGKNNFKAKEQNKATKGAREVDETDATQTEKIYRDDDQIPAEEVNVSSAQIS